VVRFLAAMQVVDLLTRLIAARSDNPGSGGPALAEMLRGELATLGPDRLELIPCGGHMSVLATWGAPSLLVNAHVDTVPINPGWSGDPFVARVTDDRVVGLGACDVKGSIAAILCALDARRPKDTAVLFSGDEEGTSSCMRALVAGELGRRAGSGLRRAIVCEPTSLGVGVRHRGIVHYDVTRSGPGGHSSRADTIARPIAELARLGVALDDWGRAAAHDGPAGFLGMCLNVAALQGGVAFNIVPTKGTLVVSLRPPPGCDVAALHAELRALIERMAPGSEILVRLDNAPFSARGAEAFRDLLGARVDVPVDLGFWTEAALLAEAGIDAVVIGPGSVACAHSPDEWVPLAELEQAVALFQHVFEATGGDG
jgi:acetylornithine deacetylase